MKKILLFLGFLVFYPSAFAAVHSVENISEKVKGDRLSLSDVNSILGTIRGFFFDDSTGFVGVGTDSPVANLEISSGNNDDGDAVLRIEADKNNDNETDNSWIDFFQDGGKTGMKVGFTGNADNDFVLVPTSDAVQSSTPAITVQLDGNIGIDTTEPDAKLHINNDAASIKTDVNNLNQSGLLIGDSNIAIGMDRNEIMQKGDHLYIGASDIGAADGGGNIYFLTDSDSDGNMDTYPLTLRKDGFVGIGTESPRYLLDLSHTNPYISFTDTNDFADRDDRFFIRAAGDGSGEGRMYFGHYDHSEASEKYLISMDESGSLGIGTTSPAANLEISSGNDGDAVLRIESDENDDGEHEDDNPSIEFFQDAGKSGMKMGLTDGAGGTANSFVFFVTKDGVESTTPALVIEQDGDL